MAPNNSNSPSGTGSAVPLGDNSATANIVESARGRSDGFDVGSDRAIANPPNWPASSSQQLYNGAVNNNDPGTAQTTGHAWTHHGNELKQASDHLYNAIAELGAAWVGQGAAGAQGSLVAIANSGAQASEAAHTMSDRLAKQASAAEEVKKMPPPRDYDPKQALTAALAGGPAALAADQKAQSDAANDVKSQQVAFFNAYTKSMSEVDSSTPSFGPESLGMKPTASHNSTSFGSIGGVGSTGPVGGLGGAGDAIFASGTGFGAFGGGADGSHGSAAASYAGQHGITGGPDGGTAGGAGFGHDPSLTGAAGTGSGQAAQSTPVTSSGGSPLGKVGMGLGIGGLAGGLGALGARTLGQGGRSGSKATDGTTAASSDGQAAQSAASASAPQQGVVSSAGTIGGQTLSPNNVPPNMPMSGMGGAHGAHAEPEEEHTHASFLIEADPDEAFGANQATPPPVIGAWAPDDEDR